MTRPQGRRLEGKRAVLIGGGQQLGASIGIGRAIALLLAWHGADLIVVDRDEAGALRTRDMIRDGGNDAAVLKADITVPEECEQLAREVGERFGHLDVLVNSVGILGNGDALETDEVLWDHVLGTNLKAMWRTTKSLLPLMMSRPGGSIVNVSSIGALGGPNLAYGISKAGVNRFTLSLASAYAKYDVRANAVLPGLIDTPMAIEGGIEARGLSRAEYVAQRDAAVPMHYKGSSDDVAHAVSFFASDESRYISGVLMPVDGALVASTW